MTGQGTHAGLNAIDWTRPWLAPYRGAGEALAATADWRQAASAAATGLQTSSGHPLRFVPQSFLPDGVAYESHIAQTGQVPTRDNLHDFFNALVWLTFPATKAQLNARQAAEIAAAGSSGVPRGRVRDAATLFDENAALLVTTDRGLLDALANHQWQEVFLQQRDRFERHCRVLLFGHALLEKLVHPFKAITAHAWPLLPADVIGTRFTEIGLRELDKRLAAELHGTLMPSRFMPLPVLGVPGWAEGQDETYYADVSVFRPRRVTR